MSWRPIPGWHGIYEVNRSGQVRSLPRTVPRGGGSYRVPGGLLSEQTVKGWRVVYLKNNGIRETVYIAVLLREVFGINTG